MVKKKTNTLLEKTQEVTRGHEASKRQGEALNQEVLKHFNNYVTRVINPQLPRGWSLTTSNSDDVLYTDGKYRITTGVYDSPQGMTDFPRDSRFQDKVLSLLEMYKKRTPWVEQISTSFHIAGN